jgi:hypothetical protein
MNKLNNSNVKSFVNAETDEKTFAITLTDSKTETEITFEEVEWLYRKMKLINKHCK